MSKYVCAALTEDIRANYWHGNRQTASKGANLISVINKKMERKTGEKTSDEKV